MNKIRNNFLLARGECLCAITKIKERIQKTKEAVTLRCIYQNALVKVYFQHNMTYRDFKNLPRRTASDKPLHNKSFDIAKNFEDDCDERGFSSLIYKFYD